MPNPPPPGATPSPENAADCRDVQLVLGLVEHMKKTYNVDPGRIFLQGMSMGNLMTALIARHCSALFAGAFGASYETNAAGCEATLRFPDGREAQFARGVIGCLADGELVSMYCETLEREGELLVSVEWFCRALLNKNVSFCNGVAYITDHHAELSFFMAELIKGLLEKDA